MRRIRNHLVLKALTALYEIAEGCGDRAYPRSFLLRFTLAFLFETAGAKEDRLWVYRQFWTVTTSPPLPKRPFDSSWRKRDALIAINGMLHDLGIEPTPALFETLAMSLKARRIVAQKPGCGEG